MNSVEFRISIRRADAGPGQAAIASVNVLLPTGETNPDEYARELLLPATLTGFADLTECDQCGRLAHRSALSAEYMTIRGIEVRFDVCPQCRSLRLRPA